VAGSPRGTASANEAEFSNAYVSFEGHIDEAMVMSDIPQKTINHHDDRSTFEANQSRPSRYAGSVMGLQQEMLSAVRCYYKCAV